MSQVRAGLIAIAFKVGPKLLSALSALVKTLKVGKVGLAAGSMAAYAYMFTWQFAALIMVSLFIHESGHVWAMKRCGLKTKGIYFLPFIGGAAVADEAFRSRKEEAFIALMGPVWGLALSLGTAVAYLVTENPLFAAAAAWIAMVNLFNLLPVNPLDGGRVFKSITFSMRSIVGLIYLAFGIVITGYIILKAGIWLFVFLLIVGTLELYIEFCRTYQRYEIESIPKMNWAQMSVTIVSYLALVAVLWGVMWYMQHVPGADMARELFVS
jgi:Zn-dependent protease